MVIEMFLSNVKHIKFNLQQNEKPCFPDVNEDYFVWLLILITYTAFGRHSYPEKLTFYTTEQSRVKGLSAGSLVDLGFELHLHLRRLADNYFQSDVQKCF